MTDVRVLIVDDEPLARRVIRDLLARYENLTIVGECRTGSEAVGAVRRLTPDLVFLDVQMPDLDGFGVLNALRHTLPPAIIFVTAYDEFAIRAFEEEALDFLLKPFTDERFHRAVERAQRRLANNEACILARELTRVLDRVAGLTPDSPPPHYLARILVSSGRRSVSIPVGSISWIEADDYYARIHVGSTSYLLRQSLTTLEQQLDPELFTRTHRSALVNLRHVREFYRVRSGCEIVLHDGSRVPVSERQCSTIVQRLGRVATLRRPS
ncbi:MAG TPA: response regulator [Longimicrobiaceae bacterium]|nr:response regulator [Longimicrobiaceae bacterium]